MMDTIRAKREEIYAVAGRHKAEKTWGFGSCARGAYYGEQSASFDIASGDLIVGEIPLRETRLVQGWIELHRDELNIEWKTLEAGGKWFTIAGLR